MCDAEVVGRSKRLRVFRSCVKLRNSLQGAFHPHNLHASTSFFTRYSRVLVLLQAQKSLETA
jgi:hypothetical protein